MTEFCERFGVSCRMPVAVLRRRLTARGPSGGQSEQGEHRYRGIGDDVEMGGTNSVKQLFEMVKNDTAGAVLGYETETRYTRTSSLTP